MTLQVTDGAEDLNGGVIKLAGTDYPAGYYSYIVYQKDSRGDDPQVIDVGVAYLDRNTNDDGKVTYPTANTTLQYKTYEK